ncbi:MAG TPA: hypothetical protein VIV55_09810 [Flavobacterium sp.]
MSVKTIEQKEAELLEVLKRLTKNEDYFFRKGEGIHKGKFALVKDRGNDCVSMVSGFNSFSGMRHYLLGMIAVLNRGFRFESKYSR